MVVQAPDASRGKPATKEVSVESFNLPSGELGALETPVEREEREFTARAVKALLSGRSGVIPARIEHEGFPRHEWALEVQNGGTRLPYEEWVEAKMELAAETEVEQPEESELPANVVPLMPPQAEAVQIETAVNQSTPLPDWRSRFSWADNQRQRERGQLPGQRRHFNSPKNEHPFRD